jgi:trimeric autotransporter adhesin
MKRISALFGLALMFCVALSGCGGVHSGGKSTQPEGTTLVSISVTSAGSATSVPVGSTLQLTVQGKYSDGSTADLTSQVTWELSDFSMASVSSGGLLTAKKAGALTAVATKGTVSGVLSLSVARAGVLSISVGGGSSLSAGFTEQLLAQGSFTDNTTQTITTQVTWQSSDSTIATVSSAGVLTALKPGSVVITGSLGTVSGTLSVVVNAASVASISVSGSPLIAGSTEQLSAIGTYSDNSTQYVTSQVVWQSSDNTVATVSASGMLTAFKAGAVTVTASLGTVSGGATITVSAATLSALTVTPTSFSIATGQSQQLLVQGVYSDGSSHDVTSQVTWGTNNAAVASVNGAGLVSGVSAGSATITATLGAVSRTASATVTALTLQSIFVTPGSASVATGQTQAFAANGLFSDGSTSDITNSVTWSSSATNFATIDLTGLATGASAGSATITATSGAANGSATLTVTAAVLTSVDISPDDETIPTGGQLPLTLTGSYSDNTTQNVTNATWSSSDPTLASVDPVSGIVTGIANSNGNTVTITASYGGMTDTTTVTVTSAVPESLQLTPDTASIAAGTTQQYSVNQIYSDGSVQPVTSGLSWILSSPATASIDADGLASGIAPGQTTVTVSYRSMTTSASLSVTSAELTAIVVTPLTNTVGVNGNVQFTATGVFSDNSTEDLTSQVAWSSSVASYALISDTGVATGLSNGTTTITASYGGLSGSATLNVMTATLVAINISPANPIVPPHSKIQLTAIGVYSDGSQMPLPRVYWRTNSARYAMISWTGLLRTKRTSSKPVVVYAWLNGIVGQTNVTVSSMTITSLQITPTTPTIAVGTTQQFSLIGTFSDGTTTVDLTPSARWLTSNWHNAVIFRSGVAIGVTPGSVSISGMYRGMTSPNATLTVSNATIQSIGITPASQTVILGSPQQFAATGLFSDGSSQDITQVSRWTSTVPTVAIVNWWSGLAYSASHGQTTINATFRGVTGSTTLDVH